MPVYQPIKPSLPKDEFRAYNKRKIFFIIISAILILGSMILLYYTFRPAKSVTANVQPVTEEQKQTTVEKPKEETKTPTSGQTYKVESGDTLFTIGQKFNIDWHEIASANNLKEPYALKVGQELIIPNQTTTKAQ